MILVLLAAAFSAVSVQSAFATFHEMNVREVYPGSAAAPESEYVELQMWASGQNLVGGHTISVYNAAGTQVGAAKFLNDVSNAANQSTIVAATPAAESEFGFTADVGLTPTGPPEPAGMLNPAGGAVCWESLDCVAWGSFSGSPKSPTGSPAAPGGIPDGMALRRSIARGCASLLEASDDRDDSAGDFDLVFPNPRPNSVAPTEHPCEEASGGGQNGPGGGKGGGGATGAPQTLLKGKPAKRTHDRTPTFRFASDEDGASFQCKIDGKPFKACRSPFTTKKLAFGHHTFKVRARDRSGELDASPASYGFKVVKAA